MKTHMRIFWLVTLMFFTTGCSGYRVACQLQSDDPGYVAPDARVFCDLEPGDRVRIKLVGGEKVAGVIQSFSTPELVLIPDADNDQSLSFSSSEIISIEVKKSYTAYKIVGVVLLAAIVIIGASAAQDLGSLN